MVSTPSSHRREKRGTSNRVATIKLGIFKSVKCTVEDLSASGAKLILPSEMELPAQFTIALTSTGQKRTHKCANRWQDGTTVGVEFLSSKLG